MIPSVEQFKIRISTRDAYGKVIEVNENIYGGVIEREDRFIAVDGLLNVFGRGTVFSSELRGFVEAGQQILIDDTEYSIRRCSHHHEWGEYHHTEIVYG